MAAMARWLWKAWLSKMKFCSFPLTMAMSTDLWTELRGVIATRGAGACGAPFWGRQSRTGRSRDGASCYCFRAGPGFIILPVRSGSIISDAQIEKFNGIHGTGICAPAAPYAFSLIDPGLKVCRVNGFQETEALRGQHRLAAAFAAVQMNFIFSRTFSPNCTSLCSWVSSSSSMHSADLPA